MNYLKASIPNALTAINLMAGVAGIIFIIEGNTDWVFLCLAAGLTADFLDGLTARILNVSSPLGVQLDSLADLITFGLFPVMLYYYLMADANTLLITSMVCLTYTTCAAFRLAKFNVSEEYTQNFSGLPSPAAGMLVMAICYNLLHSGDNSWIYFIPNGILNFGILLIGILMLIPLEFQSLKFKSISIRENIWRFLILGGSLVILIFLWLNGFLYAMLFYIVVSLIANFFKNK